MDDNGLVFSGRDEEGVIEVVDDLDARALYFGTPARQSAMSREEPHRLVLSYTRAMLSGLLFTREPRSALVLGLGGGSLPRFLIHAFSTCRIDVVERRAEVVQVAHDYFQLARSPRLRTHLCDAEVFLREDSGRTYDLVLVDLHDQHGTAPLVTEPGFGHDRGGAVPVVKVDEDEIVCAAGILPQKHRGVAHVGSQSRGAGELEIVMGHLNHLGPSLDHVDAAGGKHVHQEPGKRAPTQSQDQSGAGLAGEEQAAQHGAGIRQNQPVRLLGRHRALSRRRAEVQGPGVGVVDDLDHAFLVMTGKDETALVHGSYRARHRPTILAHESRRASSVAGRSSRGLPCFTIRGPVPAENRLTAHLFSQILRRIEPLAWHPT